MTEFNDSKRIDITKINSCLYKFKTKVEFEQEFNFKIGKILGKGTFGIVKKCLSKKDKKFYAIK